MFTRILVPIDYSAPSEAALAHARRLAERFGASLHLLHVVENVFLRAFVADPRDREQAALRQLQERLTPEDRRTLVAHASIERSDEPADEIVSYARVQDIDLIVMGTHGRSGMAHLLMGSVAEHVVRTAPCPVLTVRDLPPAGVTTIPTRILVATDFSPPSDAALDYARTLAGRLGASIHLLHVVDDPAASGPIVSEMYVAEAPVTRTGRLKDAQQRLAERLTASDREELHATTEVVFGRAADMVAHYAGDTGIDMIVMGTHGRTGVSHLLFGSVAERVVRTATCPVLTLRQAGKAYEAVPAVRRDFATG